MATGFQEGSATIYQFPLGGRRGLTATRHQETKVSTEAAARALPKMVVGGSWYHEAAIQEAERVVKR